MKLHVRDRLLLLQMLPAEGDLTMIRIVRKLREALSFTEIEHAEFQLTLKGNNYTWNPANDVGAEIEIGAKAKEIIGIGFEALNKSGKFTEAHLAIYDQIMEPENVAS